RQRLCQHGCWHRAYTDVFTASFDGQPGAEFRSAMGIQFVDIRLMETRKLTFSLSAVAYSETENYKHPKSLD
ncbi:MAG: hypothetical protein Q7U30_10540, partial [Methylicorpusculum sp.]|nr:hypothetical protein [Methylicorpusculum sp.]